MSGKLERNSMIAAEHAAGQSFGALADAYGVSRERVRQVVVKERRKEAGRARAAVPGPHWAFQGSPWARPFGGPTTLGELKRVDDALAIQGTIALVRKRRDLVRRACGEQQVLESLLRSIASRREP